MPTNVLLAPVGAGKTETALKRLIDTIHARPFAKIWVLLATKRQEAALRDRLIAYPDGRSVYFNIEFFNFYELYDHLLDAAGVPVQHLNDTARFGLIRLILADLRDAGQLDLYEQIALTPGFIRIIADFIYELKQNRVYPQDFARGARTPKDHELARIYAAYQQRLIAHDLVDREGAGWLALDVLEGNASRPDERVAGDVDLLVVDGYDHFTLVQADLLTLLAGRAKDTLVTLTTVPDREKTVGRRFRDALERLETRHARAGQLLKTQRPDQAVDQRHPDLQRLTQEIFRLDLEPKPAADGIRLIEAPDPAGEVAAVLRAVKRLLLESGVAADDVMVALRDWERYQAHFAASAQAYGLSLVMHYGRPLAQNPAIIALLNLLELPGGNFHRRDMLDVLRSPYFDIPTLDAHDVDWLERLSGMYLVSGGWAAWLEAVGRARLAQPEDETEPVDDEGAELPGRSEYDFTRLFNGLEAFFDSVTPPPEATTAGYVAWLEHLIGPDAVADPDDKVEAAVSAGEDAGQFRMLQRLRLPAAETIISRDVAALDELKTILRGMLSAQVLLAALGESRVTQWPVFLNELKTAVNNATVNSMPERSGRVLVTTAANARGLPHDHVFIVGLSESIFPAPASEDPLYLDSERLALRQFGIFLETQFERAADDGLFYELISLPRRSLTLSRPTVQDGNAWIESHLWRAVRQVFDDLPVHKLKIGAVVPVWDAASPDEALIAVADGLNDRLADVDEGLVGLYNWLYPQPRWSQVLRARGLEMRRMSRSPIDRYSGRLEDPNLIAWAAEALGSRRVWSASQLNEYGVCGYRFFARRLLNLEALQEPEQGMDVLQLGSVNHEILEKTYRVLAEQGVPITLEYAEHALKVLAEAAAVVFDTAPEKFGFRPTALWAHEKAALLRKLETLIRLDFSAGSPIAKEFGDETRYPYRFEAAFGMSREDPTVWIDLGDETPAVRVRGMIDRMDRQGDGVILVDYKTGSTKIPVSEMEAGRNFQMMVYLEAARAVLRQDQSNNKPHNIVGGLFWHIRDQKAGGSVRPDDDAMEQARRHLARHIGRGRQGDFAVRPNTLDHGRCTRHCEFHQLCRVSVTNRRKRDEG